MKTLNCRFPGIASISPEKLLGSEDLQGEFMKELVWLVGSVENEDGASLKTEEVMSKVIFIVFIFLFVLVLMGLLNAIAIGDIQVSNFTNT